MKQLQLLALDLGASNGRGILGGFNGHRVALRDIHRFENTYATIHGRKYWDIIYLYEQIKQAFVACSRAGVQPDAFGLDTWGVDYGLLDKNGVLLSNMLSYRNAEDKDMEDVWRLIPRRMLYDRTGIAHLCFNTVYQLYQQKLRGDTALEQARTLLFLPDLLAYFLTGEIGTEYTFATTSMLYNPLMRGWDTDILTSLGLPENIFTAVQPSGAMRGKLLLSFVEELGLRQTPYVAVGEHDTASAVAAIPGEGSFAFCSSGTWSLFGVETDAPVITEEAYKANFSNEGTVQGGFRPLKNIMGLWLIQECRREWQSRGQELSWDDITALAGQAPPLRSIIDPDMPEFFAAGGMEGKIQAYCKKTEQPVPETVGQIARCVYESLALKYRWALDRLEEIRGGRIDSLNIVGGGIQNRLLNQMAANAIERPVITGPVESAAMGNILMQAVALGELKGIEDVRAVVRNSTEIEYYMPQYSGAWQDAYGKLLALMEA